MGSNTTLVYCSSIESWNIKIIYKLIIGKVFQLTPEKKEIHKICRFNAKRKKNNTIAIREYESYYAKWNELELIKQNHIVNCWFKMKIYNENVFDYVPTDLVNVIKKYYICDRLMNPMKAKKWRRTRKSKRNRNN